jgi:general secretion pathway protein H
LGSYCATATPNEQLHHNELGHNEQPVAMKSLALRSSPVSRDSGTGYTLLELLVVLVILGIVASAVSISLAPGEERRMTHEVDRLAALFRLAHDETRVSGRPIAWSADIDGYQFEVDGSVRGSDVAGDPLRPRAWPFPVQHIDAPIIVFGREPLLNPVQIRIAGAERVLNMRLDEFGTLREVR